MTILFVACIQIQVLLAGLALFFDSDFWKGHSWFPRFFSLIPILMLIVFHYAQLPKKLRLHTTFLIGMMLLMFATAMFSSTFGFVSALHPVIAVALFFRTMDMLRDLKELTDR